MEQTGFKFCHQPISLGPPPSCFQILRNKGGNRHLDFRKTQNKIKKKTEFLKDLRSLHNKGETQGGNPWIWVDATFFCNT